MHNEEKEVLETTELKSSDVVAYSRDRAMKTSEGGDTSKSRKPISPKVSGGPTLRDYLDILARRRRLAMAVFAGIFLSVALYAFLVSPTYRSVAVLMIEYDPTKDGDPKAQVASALNFQSRVENAIETLKSRALAENLVEKMNLADSEEFAPSPDRWSKSIRKRLSSLIWKQEEDSDKVKQIKRENSAAKTVRKNVSVRQRGKSQLLEITMDAGAAALARKMLKTYLNLYFETKLERERRSNLQALPWLKAELSKVQTALVESEAALVSFIAEHGIVPSEDGGLTEVVDMVKKQREGVMKARELEAKLEGLKGYDGSVRFDLRHDLHEDEMLRRLKENLAKLSIDHARLRTAYSPSAPQVRMLKGRINDLEQRIAAIQNKSVSAALMAARREADVLSRGVANAREEALRVGGLGSRYAILKRDVDTNKRLHSILLQQYKETQLKARTGQANISTIDAPSYPMEPVWPRKVLLLFLGLLLGATGSVIVVFTKNFLEEREATATQLDDEFDMPTLGMVPDASRLKRFHPVENRRYEFLSYEVPSSPFADSMRNIHASILFATLQSDDIRTVAVSSAKQGEGKTFISVSLATALTCNNSSLNTCIYKRILVVDCDMRKPDIHNVFPVMINSCGLSTLLTDDNIPTERAINSYDEIPGLFYMTAGPRVPDPAALLMTDRFRNITVELQEDYDFVIFDSPPILGFPDIRILSRYSDGVVLVVDDGNLDPVELRAAASTITCAPGGRMLGLIVNKARPSKTNYLYSSYYYSGNGRPKSRR